MATVDNTTLVSQQEAKTYSFKSVGTLNTDRWKQYPIIPNEKPIGIKTPIQFGTSNDGIFKMHKKMTDQIADNFRNMILLKFGFFISAETFCPISIPPEQTCPPIVMLISNPFKNE